MEESDCNLELSAALDLHIMTATLLNSTTEAVYVSRMDCQYES